MKEYCTAPRCHVLIEEGEPRQYVRDERGWVVEVWCFDCADEDLREKWLAERHQIGAAE